MSKGYNILDFSKLYLKWINKDHNNYIEFINYENEYFNKIKNKLIELRNKANDESVNDYTNLIMKINSKLENNKHLNISEINKKLDDYYLLIIEKICPLIYNDLDEHHHLTFITATNYYLYNKEEELIKVYNLIKDYNFIIDHNLLNDACDSVKLMLKEKGKYHLLKDKIKKAYLDLNYLNDIL